MEPTYTDVAGIAAIIGRTPNAVRMLVKRREIPHVKVGRRVQFKVATVVRWMDGHRRNGAFLDAAPPPVLDSSGRGVQCGG